MKLLNICLLFVLISSVSMADQIPLRDFFKNPTMAGTSISPDGNTLAYLKPWEGRMNIFIRGVNGTPAEKRVSSLKDRDIATYFWKGNNYLVYFKDFGGDENFHLFLVDLKTGQERDLTPLEKTRVELVDDLTYVNDNEILVRHNSRKPEIFDVYRVDLKTGKLKMIYENPGDVTDYLSDQNGKLRVALRNVGTDTEVLYRDTEAEKFKPLFRFDYTHSFGPIEFAFDNKTFYSLSDLGRDTAAIVEYDPHTKKEVRILYQNPEYDVGESYFSPPILTSHLRKKILGVSYGSWKHEYAFFDPETETLYAKAQAQLPGAVIVFTSHDKKEENYTFTAISDRVRGRIFLYNKKTGKTQLLGEMMPWLKESELSEVRPIQFTARDGLIINGYLTLPKDKEPKNLPTVVNPHGGPWARDMWRFSPEEQFLASRGYAVLQLNFRGSTGYGRNFVKASFKEWGLKMQDDITDATHWLMDQGIANRKKTCIYGGSYGGYATLMGLVKEPDLYACGVDYVGVANLFTFMKTIPPYWKVEIDKMYAMVGDPEKDQAQFKATSPALNIGRIKAPLFVAQGAKDPRVNKNESDQMVNGLKARGVDVPYLVKENEGHGFHNEENRFDFYEAMEKFLKKHLN